MAATNFRPRVPAAPRISAVLEPATPGHMPDPESGGWSASVVERLVHPSADCPSMKLDEIRMADCELRGARVDRLDVLDSEIARCDAANLRTSKLACRRTAVADSRLTGAILVGAELTDVVFERCRLDLVALDDARLDRVVFRDCVLREADLGGVRGDSVVFDGCDLTGVTLTGARFARSELRSCRLDGAAGIEALRGVSMAWDDVLALAGVFAGALGIRLIDDEAAG